MLPSFEETNSPGYDDVFNSEEKPLSAFKILGQFLFGNDKDIEINNSLKNNHLMDIFIEINAGYKLNKTQDKEFIYKLLVSLNKNAELFEFMISNECKIPDKYMIIALLHVNCGIVLEHKINENLLVGTYFEKSPQTWNYYHDRLEDPIFQRDLFESWFNLLKSGAKSKIINLFRDNQSIEKFVTTKIVYPVRCFGEKLFAQATIDEYTKCLQLLKKYPKNLEMNNEINTLDLLTILEKRGYKRQGTTNIDLLIRDDIPLIFQNIIKEIKNTYTDINKDINFLSIEDQVIAEKLYTIRIPEILKQYTAIHVHSREQMLHETREENAGEILFITLNDIKEIFVKFTDEINQSKIKNLSIQQKYIREIKNKM